MRENCRAARWFLTRGASLAVATAGLADGALAGGTPENLLLILDPSRPESLYIGNYYRSVRNVPASNILYMDPANTNWLAFKDFNLDALRGYLRNAGVDSTVDYIVIMPGAPFYLSAPSLVNDSCSPVTRFSISSAYTTAFLVDDILAAAPSLPVNTANRYATGALTARAFDASVAWFGGSPSTAANARRYYIGCMLGYSGPLGNTLPEIKAMIDRSAAVDGTRPSGTFYFMNNVNDPPRNVRNALYSNVVADILARNGAAEVIVGSLPDNRHDCLGVMTGFSDANVVGAPITILPGAFGDHLTSWAATFDIEAQTKATQWITKGTSGTWGAVEEPCNYTGKFPHPRMHTYYFQGSSLGEAVFRSAGFVPFQLLLLGDPITRPWAYIPVVSVTAPGAPVSGTIVLPATATTADPNAVVSSYQLLIDGRPMQSLPGSSANFSINTTQFSDGWHDLRVLARDNTLVASTGRWLGELVVDNLGRSAVFSAEPQSGDWRTLFVFDVSSVGGEVVEVRLVQNSRVVAAAPGGAATLSVHGAVLGAGPVTVQAEALFADGQRVRSAPLALSITHEGGAVSGTPPVAYSYTKRVRSRASAVVELPASSDENSPIPTFEVLSSPAQATIAAGPAGPFRLVRPAAGAAGTDSFTFRAVSTAGASNVATVTLIYDSCPDITGDGIVNQADLAALLSSYNACSGDSQYNPDADFDLDGCVLQSDLALLLSSYGQPCMQ